MPKEFSYKDLQNQMIVGTCPICNTMKKKTMQKIEALSYAHLSDVEFRENFIKADGFCHYHSELFYQNTDILAHAILFEHLLKVKINRAKKQNSLAKKRAQTCLLCQHEKNSETLLIGLFIKGLKDINFFNTYKNKGLCCTKHYTKILNHKQAKDIDAFKKVTLEKYNNMHHHLSEIKRKNDFKNAHERLDKDEIEASKKARNIVHDPFDHL